MSEEIQNKLLAKIVEGVPKAIARGISRDVALGITEGNS